MARNVKAGPGRPKRATCSAVRTAEQLVAEGKDWEYIHKNLRITMCILTENLMSHARAGDLPPMVLARDIERLEGVTKSIEAANKVKADVADGATPRFVIPGLEEAMKETDGRSVRNDGAADTEASGVSPLRIDA